MPSPSPATSTTCIVELARAASRTRSSWACSARCGASTAATRTASRCCGCFPTSGAVRPDQGGRRERRRRRHRRRLLRRLQDRVAQPPVGHRAVPGRGDRRRRHRARHLRDGRAADRAARLAALRPAGRRRATATSSTASSPASAATATASASRPWAARSSSTTAYTGNPLVNAMCVGHRAQSTSSCSAQATGVGNPLMLVGADTGRDGIHGATPRLRTDSRRAPRRGAPPCRSATRSSRSC